MLFSELIKGKDNLKLASNINKLPKISENYSPQSLSTSDTP